MHLNEYYVNFFEMIVPIAQSLCRLILKPIKATFDV